MKTFISLLVSFLAAYFLTPFCRVLAVRLKVLDIPGRRKIHHKITALLGGVAIYLGILLGLLTNYREILYLLPVLVGASIILILGLMDDAKKGALSAKVRLLMQFLAILVVITSGIRISFLPVNLWGDIGEIIITIIWILGITNAYNYLDGMDGLATGSAILNAFCFAIILFSTNQSSSGLLAVVLIGACLGFLPYNFKNAKIFLGDAGSTLIGFLLACIALMGHWAQDHFVRISIPVLVLGVPIFDMIFTTIMRIKEEKVKTIGEWLQYGGKDHFHHYLVDLGLQPRGAVLFIYSITLALGISAIMVSNDNAIEAILTLAQSAIIAGILAVLLVVGKRRHSGWKH